MPDVSSPSEAFTRLVQIVAALRAPDGCPWDREQTIDTLKPYVLEETYELLEAIDGGDPAAIREELGDFLFEAVFVAQIAGEDGRFTLADALTAIADKLVRRHPHVFARQPGEPAPATGAEVKVKWEEIKAQEAGAKDAQATPAAGGEPRRTLLSGIPPALPSLLRAYQIGGRAAAVGFDWTRASDVVDKIEEETRELREVCAEPIARERAEEEMGDLLFAIANLSRKLGVEPETALRKANEKFTRRFTAMETAIASEGRTMKACTLDELETEWQAAKITTAF
jgi:MazG family protein